MKLRPAVIIVLALGAGPGVNLGCGRQSTPVVQPEEPPPLPPTSGTPIGHLIDDTSELKLSDDQISRLRAISDELAWHLEAADRELRPDPATAAPREEKPRGLGFRGGGRPGGVENAGRSGGTEVFPGVADGGNSEQRAQEREIVISADTANRVYRQRARHVREAIKRALALLDPAQQVIARRVLTERGVNLDTGEINGEEPGAAKLEEPRLGQPLPREP